MDWMKILAAGFLIMLLIVLFPRVKAMMENTPEGSSSDWLSALIPLALVGGFVALLVAAV